jgi:succinoglycan biosynthesis protein ExoA
LDLSTRRIASTDTQEAREKPLVSVILAVRDESDYIEACLEALAGQDYPQPRMEVILLDGGSSDDTIEKARQTAAATGVALRIEHNPGHTAAAGFNLGLSHGRGEIVIKVDGHARVAADFVSAGVRALEESGADAVGGRIQTVGQGIVGRAIALAMSSPFGVGDAAFRHAGEAPEAAWTDSVPFGAYRRRAFELAGRFAEDIASGEDDEFNYRLREAGGRILLSPSIHSEYYCRRDLGGLWRQYWRYGLAKAEVLRRHPRRLRLRHLVPSAFVLSLTAVPLLGLLDRRFLLLGLGSAGAYALANLVASLRSAGRGQGGELPYLPVVFACIHLSAGAGMLAGLLRRVSLRPRSSSHPP